MGIALFDYEKSKHLLGALCISNIGIKSSKYDKFEWEIKLIHCGYPIFVGFIVNEMHNINMNKKVFGENESEIGIFCYPNQTSLYLCKSIEPSSFQSRRQMMRSPLSAMHVIKNNHTFQFKVDFKARTCFIYSRAQDESIEETKIVRRVGGD